MSLRSTLASIVFDRLICPRYPVRWAATPEAREAVYRLRYRVYADEQGDRAHPDLDPASGRIHGPIDDDPATRIYTIGPPLRPLGTVRLRVWGPGEVPDEVRRVHSLDRLPESDRLTVGDIKLVMVDPALRGTHAAAAMLVNALVAVMKARPVDLWFAVAAPGLLRRYHQLGFDPHGGRLILATRGVEVSILGLSRDLDDLERRGSPIHRALRRAGVEQGGPTVARYRALMAADRRVCSDPIAILEELRPAAHDPAHVLSGISTPALEVLARAGVILELDAGDRLIHEGFIAKELYVILRGRVAASREGRGLGERGRGQTVGDLALPDGPSYRAATCEALEPTRVLALRPTWMRRLAAHADDLARLRGRALVGAH